MVLNSNLNCNLCTQACKIKLEMEGDFRRKAAAASQQQRQEPVMPSAEELKQENDELMND